MSDTDMSIDDYANSILGSGMLWAALSLGAATGRCSATPVTDGDVVTNAMVVRFNVSGPAATRGYLVTVSIPSNELLAGMDLPATGWPDDSLTEASTK